MFKLLFKSIVLIVLLFSNMTLFMWWINYLGIVNQHSLERTLINNVQAGISATFANPIQPPSPVWQVVQSPEQQRRPLKEKTDHLLLHFETDQSILTKPERERLEQTLRELKIGTSHVVEVHSASVPSTNDIASVQLIKLRAQNVARVIYPHTQKIKVTFRPSLKVGTVLVEFPNIELK